MLTRLVRLFTNNWVLKIAALALAILLWLAVRASEPKRATFRNIPVEVDLRDPEWRLAGEPQPSAVNVTVSGTTGDLMEMASNPPRIVLPVERVTDSVESQVVPLQWVQIPGGLREGRVVALRPDTIRLHYEKLASRTLPVKIRLRGELPDGFRLGSPISANPAAVEVRGPARALARLDSVPLQPVDIAGLRSTTNIPTSVDTAAMGDLQATPTEVNVILRVSPADTLTGPPPDTAGRRRGAPF